MLATNPATGTFFNLVYVAYWTLATNPATGTFFNWFTQPAEH